MNKAEIQQVLDALRDANAKMVDINYRATIDGIDRGKVLAAIAACEAALVVPAGKPELSKTVGQIAHEARCDVYAGGMKFATTIPWDKMLPHYQRECEAMGTAAAAWGRAQALEEVKKAMSATGLTHKRWLIEMIEELK
jgi:hypothetical protein